MEQLEIFVESLTGSILQFQVSPFETVLSLKEKIQNLQGIPASHQHLIHADRVLDNDSSLYNYNIQNGSTLRLIVQMRGGPISTRPLTADLTSQQTLLEEMATEYMESLTGDNWTSAGGDGSVASAVSGDSENHDARASSATSASPTPVPPTSQSHPRHVTLLVLRDGDQLNFYRVVDRSTSCVISNGPSATVPFEEDTSPSNSAYGDDQSSVSSDTSGSKTVQSHESRSFAPKADQRVVEDKTRQKMAELRGRMMNSNKKVHVPGAQSYFNGTTVSSGLSTTPVLLPRPPSTSLHKANASRNSINQDFAKPYAQATSSTLRRRRLPSQASLQMPSSPPKGTISSPRDQDSNGNNFASLADYFRNKEENGGTLASEMTDSPSPLPSPLLKHGQASTSHVNNKNRSYVPSDLRLPNSQNNEDVVRCSPYLRELFAGTRFFVMDEDGSKDDKSDISEIKQVQVQGATAAKPLQSKPANKHGVDPAFEHLVGESVIQRQGDEPPSKTVPRTPSQQRHLATASRSGGLANAFAAIMEHQTSQSPHASSGSNATTVKKSTVPGSIVAKGEQQKSQVETSNDDSDVLERALTTLLLKAELEHLGSSRLPVALVHPPLSSKEPTKELRSSTKAAPKVTNSSTRLGLGLHREKQSASFGMANASGRTSTNKSYAVSPNTIELKKPPTDILSPVTNTSLSVNTKLPAIAPPPNQPRSTVTRCAVCNRRTGLATTYVCRCQATFCSVHRYPETHQCTYDYKAEGRRVIQANNPVITAEKLPKI